MLKKVLAFLLVVFLIMSFSAFALQKGDKGSEVKKLQKRLLKLKYYKISQITGIYSDDEVEAVKAFQSDNGLEPTGIADDETLDLLYNNKTKRSSSDGTEKNADKYSSRVQANPVGSETNGLSYKIIDKGLDYWTDSIGSNEVFAFVAIKNTDNRFIYLDGCRFDYEDDNGHLLDTASMVSKCPDAIAPDEVGYFYVSGVNGGYLDDGVNTSNGVKLIAQFSLKEARDAVFPYEITEDKLEYEDHFGTLTPVVRGRVTNDTDEDDSLLYIKVIYKDKKGKVVAIDGTNVTDLYAGTTVGFEISAIFADTPRLKKGNIGSYEIIASPTYYQFW